MKKIRLLHRSLTVVTIIFVLTFGLFLNLSLDEVYASNDDNKDKSDSTEQVDGTAGASEKGELKFEHYEPLPIKPIHRESNNVLLGSGLAVAVLIFGGAFVLDKRNQ